MTGMKPTAGSAAKAWSDASGSDNDLTPRRKHVGVVVWCSFLAACLASLFFFGMFDPATLADDAQPPRWLANRMTGYGVLFFFFWAVSVVAAGLTVYLIDTAHASRRDGERP